MENCAIIAQNSGKVIGVLSRYFPFGLCLDTLRTTTRPMLTKSCVEFHPADFLPEVFTAATL